MKNFLPLLVLVSWFSYSSPAQAILVQSAKVNPQGVASVGGFGQLYFDPSEFMAHAQLVYGVGNNYQMEARVALGGLDTYVGGFAKNQIMTSSMMSFAVWGGLHSQGNAFIDLAPILSFDFGAIELYLGPALELSLGDADTGLTFNPGLNFGTSANVSVYAELAMKISNTPTSFIGGVRYYF
jgi:hypothetical protein